MIVYNANIEGPDYTVNKKRCAPGGLIEYTVHPLEESDWQAFEPIWRDHVENRIPWAKSPNEYPKDYRIRFRITAFENGSFVAGIIAWTFGGTSWCYADRENEIFEGGGILK